VNDSTPPHIFSYVPDGDALPDAAIASGAQAVAIFANRHRVTIADSLREDLARSVLTAAWPHLPTPNHDGPKGD
jgi:hypothetical protein